VQGLARYGKSRQEGGERWRDMKEKITIEDLREWGACAPGLLWFDERFPDGATLDELEAALRQYGPTGKDWLAWLAWSMSCGFTGDRMDRRLGWCECAYERIKLACFMPVGLHGDSIEWRLLWCLSAVDRYCLAMKMPLGLPGDTIERRLSWCRDNIDRATLALAMRIGLEGDSIERRQSWCYIAADRATVRDQYAGLIPEK
jgi:hypothetical protein